jgi:hypothetical protein
MSSDFFRSVFLQIVNKNNKSLPKQKPKTKQKLKLKNQIKFKFISLKNNDLRPRSAKSGTSRKFPSLFNLLDEIVFENPQICPRNSLLSREALKYVEK